ncbi:MAG: hypothetical protein VCB25_05575 [Myxococcota bacterium]
MSSTSSDQHEMVFSGLGSDEKEGESWSVLALEDMLEGVSDSDFTRAVYCSAD